MQFEEMLPRPSILGYTWSKAKTWLIVSSLIGLGALNILSVVNEAVHNAIFGGLKSVLASVVQDEVLSRLLRNSPTAKRKSDVANATRILSEEKATLVASKNVLEAKHTALGREQASMKSKNAELEKSHAELTSKHAALEKGHAELTSKHAALEKGHAELTSKHADLGRENAATLAKHAELKSITAQRTATTKTISKRLATRAVRNATRNSSSVLAESIPYLGVAVVLGVTALDLHDACQTLKDMNELNAAFEQAQEDPSKVCGLKVPNGAEVVAKIKAGPKAIYKTAVAALRKDGVAVDPAEPADSTEPQP